ncbi:MAG: NADPH:quinone reductase [Terriglobales bacterium]
MAGGNMKAIVVNEFGGPEVLRLAQADKPEPGAGQVLVRVKAAGVNPYDTYIRAGTYAIKPALPYTPGGDAAGVVEAVGAGVSSVRAGDRVYTAGMHSGGYSEFALAGEAQVHPLPENVSFAQGAAVGVPYATAYHALVQQARARAGEKVLIHGASGGVGIAAVQLARALGLTVFASAGSATGLDLVKREGADQIFDHSQAGYQERILAASGGGVDVILEMLANVNLGADLKLLAREGRVVVIGSRGDVTISPRDLMARRARVLGFTLWGAAEAELCEIHAGLVAGLRDGTLRPVAARQLPLAEAAEAHRLVMAPGAHGKIVLIP